MIFDWMEWNGIESHQIESLLENRRQFQIEMTNVSTYTLEFHHWKMGVNAQKLLSLIWWHSERHESTTSASAAAAAAVADSDSSHQ